MQACPLCHQNGLELIPTPQDEYRVVSCPRCGTYRVEDLFVMAAPEPVPLPALSGLARERHEAGDRIVITRDNYRDLVRLAPTTMRGKARKLLLALARKGGMAGSVVDLDPERDYPLAYAASPQEIGFIFTALSHQKLLTVSSGKMGSVLTYDGWIEAERHAVPEADKAFVAMWFTPEMDSIYREGIAPAIGSVGYRAVKVDDVEHVGKIDDRIIAEIKESRFIVADFTGHRGGVYFEAGYALGLGLPVIWTCRQDHVKELHFDIRQYNCIVWEKAGALSDKLANRIRAAVGSRR